MKAPKQGFDQVEKENEGDQRINPPFSRFSNYIQP